MESAEQGERPKALGDLARSGPGGSPDSSAEIATKGAKLRKLAPVRP